MEGGAHNRAQSNHLQGAVLSDQSDNEQGQPSRLATSPAVLPAILKGTAADDPELISWVGIASAAADDKLGQQTDAFYVGGILGITDWFVVTSGRGNRQVRAIVDGVEEDLAKAGGPKPIRIEGRDTLNWVLMDYGFLVVHVFTEEARLQYDLERLWRDVPRLGLTA